MNKNFQIYRSSAGSGKTYTLALNFISLSLRGGKYGYKDYYRRILAITFTNKAAAEMKERVLHYLHLLSECKDVDNILNWLINDTGFEEEKIFERSAVVHKHILYNYSDLSISTIDKFTYKIVKTFASDLGFSYNFDVEMNNDKIIQPAVALLLARVSDSGDDLSNSLINFAAQKAEDGKSTNIEHDLENFAHQLFREEIGHYVKGSFLTVKTCMHVKKYLQKHKKDLILKIKELRDTVCSFFDMNGLTKEHFRSGTFYNHFTHKIAQDDDVKWKPTDTLLENIANDVWYSQSSTQSVKNKVDPLKSHLRKFIDELMSLLNDYYSIKAVLKNIYVIAVLNELMNVIEEFKKENNIEHISAFNKKINDIVANQPSLFIYERLGERYNHYLIDEFQDTSLLQWQNILPLVTDSLDFGKSMLVGDGKQSIYRWRGGEVEQFSKLPQIFKGENLDFKVNWENKLQNHYTFRNLKENYRSKKHIVEFNNSFFGETKKLLSNELKEIYNELEQNSQHSQEGGYVHIELFGDKKNDFKQLILQKIVDEIQKITTLNGYSYNDIAILCNTRKHVSFVADILSKNGIPVISNEGLLLCKSDKVNTIISMMRYLQNQSDDIAKLVVAEYLWKYNLSNEYLQQIHLEIKNCKGFLSVLKRANIHITKSSILEKPLYQLVEHIIMSFNFQGDVYLDFFLDAVLSYVNKEGSSISGFLNWWQESVDQESIIVPEETDAVQIMTIHKAKGLAFSVVIIPFNWEDRNKNSDIWVDTSDYFNKELPAALIGGGKQLKLSYFKDDYQKEQEMRMLDNLNKLYVAMTRPKERLYIFSKSLPSNLKNYEKKQNLNSFLCKYSHVFPIIIGDPDMMRQVDKSFKKNLFITKQKKLNWEDVIALKHTAEEIWDTETSVAKRDWGKLLHLVLSKIDYACQKDDVIDQMYKLGRFTDKDYKKLKRVVTDLLNHDQVKIYFTDDWNVKNEKEILMTNGRTYVPDRLLFSKKTNKVVIIDYKTGKMIPKHENQIVEYSNALMLMGKTNVEKVLIYTSEKIKVVRL